MSNPEMVLTSDPDTLGGTVVFAGTRVPLQTFIDWMMHGYTLEEFLDNFPTVTRDQIERFLLLAGEKLTNDEISTG